MVVEIRDGDAVRAPAAAVLPDAVEGRIEGAAGGELVEHGAGSPRPARIGGQGGSLFKTRDEADLLRGAGEVTAGGNPGGCGADEKFPRQAFQPRRGGI